MKWLKMITAICLISVVNVGCVSLNTSGSNYYGERVPVRCRMPQRRKRWHSF